MTKKTTMLISEGTKTKGGDKAASNYELTGWPSCDGDVIYSRNDHIWHIYIKEPLVIHISVLLFCLPDAGLVSDVHRKHQLHSRHPHATGLPGEVLTCSVSGDPVC